MSEIRAYLEDVRAMEGDNGWLKRERTTHPLILATVRAFRKEAAAARRVAYNDDVERRVEELAGDLPEHHYHAHPDRDPLTQQLGHEVYIAQCICRDEDNLERAVSLRLQGFAGLDGATPGRIYDVAGATLYSGYSEPTYGAVRERCRLVRFEPDGAGVFLPPRARTNGFVVQKRSLVKAR